MHSIRHISLGFGLATAIKPLLSLDLSDVELIKSATHTHDVALFICEWFEDLADPMLT